MAAESDTRKIDIAALPARVLRALAMEVSKWLTTAAGDASVVGKSATLRWAVDGHIVSPEHRMFLGTSVLLFIAGAATTIYLCQSMSGGMAMPGGWIMSMAWMRMPGQSWVGSAASFLGMWVVMMAAMMLPALVPSLFRYRLALRGRETIYLSALTALAGAGYFFVWALLGAVLYPLGVLVAKAGMSSAELSRSMPIAAGMVLLLAGGLQLTAWKARQLCRCRDVIGVSGGISGPQEMNHGLRSAWALGMRLGTDCALCCSGMMAILLVTGVMNLGAMALVTFAITAERVFRKPELAARGAGFVTVATGAFTICRAISRGQ